MTKAKPPQWLNPKKPPGLAGPSLRIDVPNTTQLILRFSGLWAATKGWILFQNDSRYHLVERKSPPWLSLGTLLIRRDLGAFWGVGVLAFRPALWRNGTTPTAAMREQKVTAEARAQSGNWNHFGTLPSLSLLLVGQTHHAEQVFRGRTLSKTVAARAGFYFAFWGIRRDGPARQHQGEALWSASCRKCSSVRRKDTRS